jgi:transposase
MLSSCARPWRLSTPASASASAAVCFRLGGLIERLAVRLEKDGCAAATDLRTHLTARRYPVVRHNQLRKTGRLIRQHVERHNRRVLEMIFVVVRALALACRGHHELVLENLALRRQLHVLRRRVAGPQLRRRDRLFWIVLAQMWRNWCTALVLVQPDTVVRWHREWLRRRWRRRSAQARAGRPSTDAAIGTLVSAMAAANPLWGTPRIHGELCKLGIAVSERTVSRLLRRPRRPLSQTWRTFLTNHVATLGYVANR